MIVTSRCSRCVVMPLKLSIQKEHIAQAASWVQGVRAVALCGWNIA